MPKKSVHKISFFVLLILVAVLLALPLFEQAMAASCSLGGSLSQQQRDRLNKLPNGLRSVLQAVKRQRQTACNAPQTGFLQTEQVDPLPIPSASLLAISFAPDSVVAKEVVAVITGDGSNIQAIADANNLVVISSRRSALLGGYIVRYSIPDDRSIAAVTAILQANTAIISPGPNHLYRLQGDVQKASIYEQARFAPKKLGQLAQEFNLSGKDILIGVIDTAIDPDHPDLKEAVFASFDALPGQPISNRTHGTAVAGLIVGRSMIRGVAPRAKLLVARAFDDNRGESAARKASATSIQLLAALDWTVAKGAHIINMSFTGPRNLLMSKALAAAAKKNVLLIAAAGNNGPSAPAAYPAAEPSVLAVTATDIDDRIYTQANIGRYVFVAAPGVDVLAAAPDKGIDLVSGTSFAAPFLSGLAALLLEQNSTMTPRQFAERIAKSSQDLGQPGRDEIFGVGLADLNKALIRE